MSSLLPRPHVVSGDYSKPQTTEELKLYTARLSQLVQLFASQAQKLVNNYRLVTTQIRSLLGRQIRATTELIQDSTLLSFQWSVVTPLFEELRMLTDADTHVTQFDSVSTIKELTHIIQKLERIHAALIGVLMISEQSSLSALDGDMKTFERDLQSFDAGFPRLTFTLMAIVKQATVPHLTRLKQDLDNNRDSASNDTPSTAMKMDGLKESSAEISTTARIEQSTTLVSVEKSNSVNMTDSDSTITVKKPLVLNHSVSDREFATMRGNANSLGNSGMSKSASNATAPGFFFGSQVLNDSTGSLASRERIEQESSNMISQRQTNISASRSMSSIKNLDAQTDSASKLPPVPRRPAGFNATIRPMSASGSESPKPRGPSANLASKVQFFETKMAQVVGPVPELNRVMRSKDQGSGSRYSSFAELTNGSKGSLNASNDEPNKSEKTSLVEALAPIVYSVTTDTGLAGAIPSLVALENSVPSKKRSNASQKSVDMKVMMPETHEIIPVVSTSSTPTILPKPQKLAARFQSSQLKKETGPSESQRRAEEFRQMFAGIVKISSVQQALSQKLFENGTRKAPVQEIHKLAVSSAHAEGEGTEETKHIANRLSKDLSPHTENEEKDKIKHIASRLSKDLSAFNSNRQERELNHVELPKSKVQEPPFVHNETSIAEQSDAPAIKDSAQVIMAEEKALEPFRMMDRDAVENYDTPEAAAASHNQESEDAMVAEIERQLMQQFPEAARIEAALNQKISELNVSATSEPVKQASPKTSIPRSGSEDLLASEVVNFVKPPAKQNYIETANLSKFHADPVTNETQHIERVPGSTVMFNDDISNLARDISSNQSPTTDNSQSQPQPKPIDASIWSNAPSKEKDSTAKYAEEDQSLLRKLPPAHAPEIILVAMNGYQLLPGATAAQPYLSMRLDVPARVGRSNAQKYVNFYILSITQVVSRYHLEVVEQDGQFYLTDVGSNSGTWLNGKRLSEAGVASERIQIQSGDMIRLGADFKAAPNDGLETKDIKHRCIVCRIICRPHTRTKEDGQYVNVNQGTPRNQAKTVLLGGSELQREEGKQDEAETSPGANANAKFLMLQKEIEEKKVNLQKQFLARYDQLQERMQNVTRSDGSPGAEIEKNTSAAKVSKSGSQPFLNDDRNDLNIKYAISRYFFSFTANSLPFKMKKISIHNPSNKMDFAGGSAPGARSLTIDAASAEDAIGPEVFQVNLRDWGASRDSKQKITIHDLRIPFPGVSPLSARGTGSSDDGAEGTALDIVRDVNHAGRYNFMLLVGAIGDRKDSVGGRSGASEKVSVIKIGYIETNSDMKCLLHLCYMPMMSHATTTSLLTPGPTTAAYSNPMSRSSMVVANEVKVGSAGSTPTSAQSVGSFVINQITYDQCLRIESRMPVVSVLGDFSYASTPTKGNVGKKLDPSLLSTPSQVIVPLTPSDENFDKSKLLVVIKRPAPSRYQRLLGEFRGKQILKKSLRDSKWIIGVEFTEEQLWHEIESCARETGGCERYEEIMKMNGISTGSPVEPQWRYRKEWYSLALLGSLVFSLVKE